MIIFNFNICLNMNTSIGNAPCLLHYIFNHKNHMYHVNNSYMHHAMPIAISKSIHCLHNMYQHHYINYWYHTIDCHTKALLCLKVTNKMHLILTGCHQSSSTCSSLTAHTLLASFQQCCSIHIFALTLFVN
jgi:hypothetical protein